LRELSARVLQHERENDVLSKHNRELQSALNESFDSIHTHTREKESSELATAQQAAAMLTSAKLLEEVRELRGELTRKEIALKQL
jgi:hypothetical protein